MLHYSITLHQSSPINDAVPMQEAERQSHLGRVETGARLVKFAGALDLEHQVPAVHVLHDEEQTVLDGGADFWSVYG